MRTIAEPEYMRLVPASRRFNISVDTLLRLAKEARLRIYRPTEKIRLIRTADLLALIEGGANEQQQ